MNEKIMTRIANVDDEGSDSLIFCWTADKALVENISYLVDVVNMLEYHADGLAPVTINFSLDVSVYEGLNADESLRDELWDAYEGVTVTEFPKMNEKPAKGRISLSIENPFERKKKQPDYCAVWLSYHSSSGRVYAAPIRFLGNLVEQLFTNSLVVK